MHGKRKRHHRGALAIQRWTQVPEEICNRRLNCNARRCAVCMSSAELALGVRSVLDAFGP
jgi:hypothetical protein